MIKKLIFALLFVGTLANAQEETEKTRDPKATNKLYVKGNVLVLPALLLNFGLEKQLAPKITLQGDFFISPYKSIGIRHARLGMAHLEGRYYFSEAFHKWYVGANFGMGLYNLTKWNYWKFDYEVYEKGYNFMMGAVVGYQFQWKERWNIDVFLRGGNQQAFYKNWMRNSNDQLVRFDQGVVGYNKSGEWIPYGGGIMLSYRLK